MFLRSRTINGRSEVLVEYRRRRNKCSVFVTQKLINQTFTNYHHTPLEMNSNTSYNVKCVSDEHSAECLERPAKRMRSDSVSVLAGIGISNFQRGKHCTAAEYFSQALSRSMKDITKINYQKTNEVLHAEIISESDSSSRNEISERRTIRACHEYDEGLQVYETPFDIDDIFSSEDAIATSLFYNIALTYVHRRLYEDARKLFARALSCSKKPLCIFKILNNLGYTSYRCGSFQKALFFYEQAIGMAPHLCLSDAALAATINSAAVLYFHEPSCSTQKALTMFQRSLQLYRLDEENCKNQIATVHNNIGRVRYLKSECKKALESYFAALNLRKPLLGEFSMDVAATYYNIGQAYHQLRDLKNAKEYYDLFLQVALCSIGPLNTEISVVYKCIGDIYFDRRELKLALGSYEQSLASSRVATRNSDPSVAATLNKAGNLCYEMKNYDKALEYYKEGLTIEMNILEPNHPHMIITFSNIAHVHKLRGEYAKSLAGYKRVCVMQQNLFGANSTQVANTLSNIGLMEYNLKEFENAFESYQEALRIHRELNKDENHLCIASTLNSIGLVLCKQTLFLMAKECFIKALNIRQSVLGSDHHEIAVSWYNIATTYFETGEDDKAIEIYKEALRIERQHLGEDHKDVIQTIHQLASIFQQLGRVDEAAQHFEFALKQIQNKKQGRNFKSEVKLLNQLGNLYLQNANMTKAMEYYTEATRMLRSNKLDDESLLITGFNYYALSRLHPPCASVA